MPLRNREKMRYIEFQSLGVVNATERQYEQEAANLKAGILISVRVLMTLCTVYMIIWLRISGGNL